MNDFNFNQVWWENVSGPRAFLEKALDALHSKNSLALRLPADMPCRDEFRSNVTNSADGYHISIIDVCDSFGNRTIEEYFLEELSCDQGGNYRGEDFFEYYRAHCLPTNTVFWFKGIPQEKQQDFYDFCKKYMKKGRSELPLLAFEITADLKLENLKSVEYLDWFDYVTPYDSLEYGFLTVSQIKSLTSFQKNYVANVCAEVFGYDVEIFTEALTDDTLREGILNGNFETVLATLADEYPRRGEKQAQRSDDRQHVLYLYRNGKREEIDRKIWRAQLNVFYPAIELFRAEFIAKWKTELQAQLERCEYFHNVDGEKVRLVQASEIEINQLRIISSDCGLLDEKQFNEMVVYRDTRNCLAHLSRLPSELLQKLWASPLNKK